MRSTRVAFLALVLAISGHAQADVVPDTETDPEPLSPACQDMAGTYAVPALGDSPRFKALVAELGHPDYQLGRPMLEVKIADDGLSRVGAISGDEVALAPASHGAAASLFSEASVRCALSDVGSGGDSQLAHVDLSAMPQPELQALAEYLGKSLDVKISTKQLRGMHDFVVIDASMIGVASIFYALPLKKL